MPSSNERYSTRFTSLEEQLRSPNSFQTKASRQQRTGEIHWIQPIQSGYPPALEKKPLNKIRGIMITGATARAVSDQLNKLDTKKPKEEELIQSIMRMRQQYQNWPAVTLSPTPKQVINAQVRGWMISAGMSKIIFPIQYGATWYILLAYSLRKTGLSSWKASKFPCI